MTDAAKLKAELQEEILASIGGLADIAEKINMIECGPSVKNHVPAEVLQKYPLAFEDVFKGQTQLDPTKWRTSHLWGPDLIINNEEQYYVDTLGGAGQQNGVNPFSFDADGLVITAAPTQDPSQWVASSGTPQPGGQRYTSGIITTRDSLCFTGGYMGVCLKNPCVADGMWTAAWLLNCMYYDNADEKNNAENGGVGNDKFNPEIDWEWVRGNNNNACALMASHYFTGDRNDPNNYSLWTLDESNFRQVDANTFQTQSQFNVYQDKAGNSVFNLPKYCDIDSCTDFHEYGIWWEPNDFIRFYIDGVCIRAIEGADNIISDQAMYMLINFAIGGNFPFGIPASRLSNQADYPATMHIEYARIYTK